MADVQIENGYLRLAHELLQALIKYRLTGAEWDVMMTVASCTYGWNKKEDQISISRFMKLTGLTRPGVIKTCRNLVNRNILASKPGDTRTITTYWIQKDYEKWTPSKPQAPRIPQFTTPSKLQDQTLVNCRVPTKDNIQKTITNVQVPHEAFEALWSQYPRREGKKEALKHFNATVSTQSDLEGIQRALQNYNRYLKDNNTEPRFFKMGSTWFNNWKDWVVDPVSSVNKDILNDPRKRML